MRLLSSLVPQLQLRKCHPPGTLPMQLIMLISINKVQSTVILTVHDNYWKALSLKRGVFANFVMSGASIRNAVGVTEKIA